jgi:hypothetical protein
VWARVFLRCGEKENSERGNQEHISGAKAQFVVRMNVRAKARTYLKSKCKNKFE